MVSSDNSLGSLIASENHVLEIRDNASLYDKNCTDFNREIIIKISIDLPPVLTRKFSFNK